MHYYNSLIGIGFLLACVSATATDVSPMITDSVTSETVAVDSSCSAALLNTAERFDLANNEKVAAGLADGKISSDDIHELLTNICAGGNKQLYQLEIQTIKRDCEQLQSQLAEYCE